MQKSKVMNRYKAAIIGCGRVAWQLELDPLETKPCSHMGGYLGLGSIDIIAGADINEDNLNAFGKAYNISNLYLDYKDMLNEERPDVVSICAYATDRCKMVLDAIDAGVKGIWCEKAFAASLKEADEMVDACRENNVSMIVSHMRRWSFEYQKAKEIIESGGIGKLQSIVAHFSGSMLHTGTHAFDVLTWFAGDAQWVEGWLEKRQGNFQWDGIEDLGGRAFVQFKNNVYATVHAEAKAYFFFEFDIIGSHGRIRIGNNEVMEFYKPDKSRHYTGLKELYIEKFPEFESKNIWIEAARNLVGCMEGKMKNLNAPDDGRAALEIALAIHESSREDGKRVYLPLDDREFKVRSR